MEIDAIQLTLDIIKKKFGKIKFKEDEHKYYLGEYCFPISSTQRVHKFTEPFDKDKRTQYTADKRNKAGEFKEDGTPRSKEDIAEEWKEKAKLSTDIIGTPFHYFMELFNKEMKKVIEDNIKNSITTRLTNKIYTDEDVDEVANKIIKQIDHDQEMYNQLGGFKKEYGYFFEQAKMFYKEYNYLYPIASEVVIGDRSIEIAGMVDQLYYNMKEKEIQIRDWKTNKEIKSKGYNDLKMRDLFQEVDDCNYGHYSVQLSLYKYILTKAKISIGNMYLGHFPSGMKDIMEKDGTMIKQYNVYQVKDLSSDIKKYFYKQDLF